MAKVNITSSIVVDGEIVRPGTEKAKNREMADADARDLVRRGKVEYVKTLPTSPDAPKQETEQINAPNDKPTKRK